MILHLRNTMKNLESKNLAAFKRRFGNKYRYRFELNGLTRYKWIKGLIHVRARFDEIGKLNDFSIRLNYKFWSLKNFRLK